MRENEPGSVCSLGGELVLGTYKNSMKGALSTSSNAHRTFKTEYRGIMSGGILEGFVNWAINDK